MRAGKRSGATRFLVLHANDSIEAAHHVATWVKLAPLAMGLAGIALAWLFYMKRTDLPRLFASAFQPVHQLFFRKWYFDEIYNFVFVRGGWALGRFLWKGGDVTVIDGLGPERRGVGGPGGRAAYRPTADRVRLPLRLRHADRRRRADQLVHLLDRRMMGCRAATPLHPAGARP